ncbi:MAG: hypothetical protein ACE361_17220 [Aureliella sp.]
MHTFRRLALSAAALIATAPAGLCQERGFPVINYAGRFLGYGWTKGGYHAPVNAQIAVVKHRHPAHAYRSSGLQYPYSPGYQPMRAAPVNYGLPARQNQWNQGGYMQPTPAPAPPATQPQQLKPPAGPPPAWLEQYMEEKKTDDKEEISPPPPTESNEALPQPSARRNAGDPFGYDQSPESSPSDRSSDSLLDEPTLDDNLLESGDDDDDLLLLDDDFTLRQRPRSRTGTTTAQNQGAGVRALPVSHRNRYRGN